MLMLMLFCKQTWFGLAQQLDGWPDARRHQTAHQTRHRNRLETQHYIVFVNKHQLLWGKAVKTGVLEIPELGQTWMDKTAEWNTKSKKHFKLTFWTLMPHEQNLPCSWNPSGFNVNYEILLWKIWIIWNLYQTNKRWFEALSRP